MLLKWSGIEIFIMIQGCKNYPIEKENKDETKLDTYHPLSNLHPVEKMLEDILKSQNGDKM